MNPGLPLRELADGPNTPQDLMRQNVSSTSWTWGDSVNPVSSHPWATGICDSGGHPLYSAGTYTVSAESYLNNMKPTYRNGGADYTGKTVSQSYMVTLDTEALKIESSIGSVARGAHFSVTITGKPKTAYYLWVSNTGSFSGTQETSHRQSWSPPRSTRTHMKGRMQSVPTKSLAAAAGRSSKISPLQPELFRGMSIMPRS